MSTRHRWFAVYLALAVSLPSPNLSAKPSDASGSDSGPVGLSELIALALQNDPELVALRYNIPVEEARKRAAKQWRDPEIRVGFSKDQNIQLDQPYERSGVISETTAGTLDRTDTELPSNITNEAGTSAETRTTRYKETVIPGPHGDRIIREEYQNRATDATTIRSRPGFDPTTETRSETETFRSRSEEYRYDSRDRFARDQTTSIKARFWIPNPWEMKQRVNVAAKEVDLATFKVKQAERKVILRVREDYEKLQYLHKKLETSRTKIPVIEAHLKREAELFGPGSEVTIDQSRFENLEIPTIEMDILDAEVKLSMEKSKLAASVGLSDGNRIRLTDPLLRSTIELQSTDLDYLTRMAFAFRGELGVLKYEQAIAESELDLVNSKKIPFFSFIEAGYAKDSTGGYHTNDNYGVQFGVVLPLFSWLSKDAKVVETRIESYYGSLQANEQNIANEVAVAFRAVKAAAKHRNEIESRIAKLREMLEATTSKLDESEDLVAKERLKFRIETKRSESREHVLEADRFYNQALIRLEQALGADLDNVFHINYEALPGAVSASAAEVTAAAEPSAYPSVPRAKPIAEPIRLKSQPANSPSSEKGERRGLFSRPKPAGFSKFKNR